MVRDGSPETKYLLTGGTLVLDPLLPENGPWPKPPVTGLRTAKQEAFIVDNNESQVMHMAVGGGVEVQLV